MNYLSRFNEQICPTEGSRGCPQLKFAKIRHNSDFIKSTQGQVTITTMLMKKCTCLKHQQCNSIPNHRGLRCSSKNTCKRKSTPWFNSRSYLQTFSFVRRRKNLWHDAEASENTMVLLQEIRAITVETILMRLSHISERDNISWIENTDTKGRHLSILRLLHGNIFALKIFWRNCSSCYIKPSSFQHFLWSEPFCDPI